MRKPIKPPALVPGGRVRVLSTASPAEAWRVRRGVAELERLGYRVLGSERTANPDGYFAAPEARRRAELEDALRDAEANALICARGGYGTSPLLEGVRLRAAARAKLVIGYSDVTALHVFLWQRLGWTSLYGPMVAAGFDGGAGRRDGYDQLSFVNAAGGCETWQLKLGGDTLVGGTAAGVLLGGCVSVLVTTLGTPWELDTRGAILLLEDVAVKPYEVDRMLVHLLQAGKLRGVRGIVLGDFPGCAPPKGSRTTVRDVCRRLLAPLGVPAVYGAPVGHTLRPMLTVPLGVRARLRASGAGKLDILEPATQQRRMKE